MPRLHSLSLPPSHVRPSTARVEGLDPPLDPAALPSRTAAAWQWQMKRVVDIVGATAFFIFLGPLYVGVAIAVFVGMGRPVHFGQPRRGEGGRAFRFYKFRSMPLDADHILQRHLDQNDNARRHWQRYQKLENDPRVTPLGRLIRRLSLDELPQFWNVLKGDMSLVGPRPCMVRQRSLYGEHWPHYCAVRPGITGLWQVSGRNRLTFAERAALDARYVAGWSLGLDFRILAKTVRAVASGDGSH